MEPRKNSTGISGVPIADACAEQFDARSSIHLALECFKTVNVSLDRSVAPVQLCATRATGVRGAVARR
jgi:hypothetical protein